MLEQETGERGLYCSMFDLAIDHPMVPLADADFTAVIDELIFQERFIPYVGLGVSS